MREETAEYRKIECTMCGWETMLDLDGVYDWLVSQGILKPNHAIDDELVYELFHSMTDRFLCPDCASPKLKFSVVRDDFSDLEERRCRGCRNVIPRERIAILPDVQYCVSCAAKLEKGEPLPILAEYCPICGKMMELIEVHEGRRVEWKWVCTSVPSCRYRKS